MLSPALDAQMPDMKLLKNMKARSIGPAGMSGRITAIAAVESNPEIIYAGAASGGIWKSTDGGVLWKPVFDDQKLINIGALAICQSNPDVVWAGTGEGNPRNSVNLGGGIFKSPDGGKSWKLTGLEESRNIHRILIDPRDENTVYAGVIGNPYGEHPERGVYKTTDGGETWEKILFVDGKTGVGEMVMDPTNPNKLMVNMWEHRRWPWFFKSGGPGSGLYVTLDGGKSWQKRGPANGLPEGDLGRMGLAIAASDPSVVYALVESSRNALYKSADGGLTFTKTNDSPSIGNRPFYYYEIYADPKDPKRLYSLHSGISLSDDGGRSFTQIGDVTHPDHHAFWIHPDDPAYIIEGNDGGLNISRDQGKTWRFAENLPIGQFYHIRVDNDMPYNVYGGLQDNGSWCGPGYTWKSGGIVNTLWHEVSYGDGFDVMPDPGDNRYVYTMSQQGSLIRYDIATGNSYTIKPTAPDLQTKLRFHWNSPLEQDPFDQQTIYFGSQFLHRSSDKGLTWEIISPDLTTNDPGKQKYNESGGLTYDVTGAETHTCIIAIAPSPLQKGVIWVGTDDGNVQLTVDGGKTWSEVGANLPGLPRGSWIPQVRASRYQASEAWVVANNYRNADFTPYAYHTSDFGKSWRRIAGGDGLFGYALCLLQDPVEPNLLFLGTEHGLWVSIDKGSHWTRWTHGFPAVSTMDLELQEREADLVIGTFGRSVYILDDIRPLREMAASGAPCLRKPLTLFQPPDAVIVDGIQRFSGSHFPADAVFQGENKPAGARIKVFLNPAADTALLPGKSEQVNSSQKKQKAAKPGAATPASGLAARIHGTGPVAEKPASQADPGKHPGSPSRDSLRLMVYNQKGQLIKTITQLPDTGLNIVSWQLDEGEVRFPRRTADTNPGRRGFRGSMGKQVLPGTYKIVARYGECLDSATLNVLFDPRIPKSPEVLTAQRQLTDSLLRTVEVLAEGTRMLGENMETASRLSALAAARNDQEARALQKEAKSIRDSIGIIQDYIFGKQNDNVQGIYGRQDVTVTGKVMEALQYIRSRPGKPSATEYRLVEEAKFLIREAAEKINRFHAEVWPAFRKKAEDTPLPLFRETKPLQVE